MKVVFAGPSIYGANKRSWNGIQLRSPARHGDIAKAVLDGAAVIGLIDGCYETTAAAWHKELLFALSQGVAVFGGASIGALRAAECAEFGMQPVGVIAAKFINGDLLDDDEVALVHAPEELAFRPLTIAMVDIRATVGELRKNGALTDQEVEAVLSFAKQLFFKERTLDRIAEALAPERRSAFMASYQEYRRSQKLLDALDLVAAVMACEPSLALPDWHLNKPQSWREALDSLIG